VFLYLSVAGGGVWSIDHCVLGREPGTNPESVPVTEPPP